MIEIATVIDAERIGRLRGEWEALWQRDPTATPFQSPAWLLAWWRFFGTPEPVVLTARESGELVAILSLYLLREPGCRKLLPVGVGVSDYIDALLDPNEPEAAELLMAAIADTPGWDECWLPDLSPEGVLGRSAAAPGLTEAAAPASPCPVLTLPRDPAALREAVPRKTLRDLHQARARAAATGEVMFETVAQNRLDAAMDDLFRLHERRWLARGEPGVCDDPRVRDFQRAAAAGLLAAGMLRMYRLWIDDAVLAVYYGFVAKGRAYAYLGGFDPSQPRLSPGSQVIAHAIEQASAEGAQRFDFLRGGEDYKYAWGAVDRIKISRHLSPRCTSR
jgi:CelD/BcsL family acetyltransferase involved in cellulose biosynthesis